MSWSALLALLSPKKDVRDVRPEITVYDPTAELRASP